jgi:beta-glucosidase
MKKTCFTLSAFLIFFLVPFLVAQPFPYQDSTLSIDQRVSDLLGRMTLDEKIGQMMQVQLTVFNSSPSILTTYNIGSVFSGGGESPSAGKSAIFWANSYDTLQTYALKTRLKIPMIYGVDAVHGHNNVYGATIFPHNIGIGCTRNPQLAKEAARITAEEVAATGINWTFGPCIAVPRDERWGRTYEGYGETPELAQLFGSSVVRGFQGDSLSGQASILACAKHYLGDGGTTNGTDKGNTQLDTTEIRRIHLPGYISAIDSGVGSIMVSFSSINGVRMHGNKYWLTDVLKNELGFKGMICSDYGGIDNVGTSYTNSVNIAINAGIDMVMLPNQYIAFSTAMKSLISAGSIDTARVDDAARRILTAKFKLGLFERPFTDRSLLDSVGSSGHRAVARQCVRESLVLLKKKDGILPLRKSNARILVAGANADNLGNQCGGWTIAWQGQTGNTLTIGTTILQGMRNTAASATIEYSSNGAFSDTSADYSVAVIGETPYAEGPGYSPNLSLSQTDVDLVKKMKGFGAPVVVILVSGRPLILDKILHFSDVIIAAWLPGTEGGGLSDILFGDYQPKGRLSHTWPKSISQVPINFGDIVYSPLYEYGFGIDTLADSPVGSPPVGLSGIITPDAKHFELTFNKRMKDPSSEEATFILTRNKLPLVAATTLSLKQNDSTTIIVGLDTAYYSSHDLGTIAYSSGTIKSADEGSLQPFAPMDAYNWTGSSAAVKEDKNLIPLVNKLDQNYPNPFNPTTVITYQLLTHGYATLKVYDVLGREVATLVNGEKSSGVHTVSWDASRLSSGVFIYRLKIGNFNDVKKMILMK